MLLLLLLIIFFETKLELRWSLDAKSRGVGDVVSILELTSVIFCLEKWIDGSDDFNVILRMVMDCR